MNEQELAAEVLKTIRTWMHGWSQCYTPGEKAICTSTMHNLMEMVFDFDEAVRTPQGGKGDGLLDQQEGRNG